MTAQTKCHDCSYIYITVDSRAWVLSCRIRNIGGFRPAYIGRLGFDSSNVICIYIQALPFLLSFSLQLSILVQIQHFSSAALLLSLSAVRLSHYTKLSFLLPSLCLRITDTTATTRNPSSVVFRTPRASPDDNQYIGPSCANLRFSLPLVRNSEPTLQTIIITLQPKPVTLLHHLPHELPPF